MGVKPARWLAAAALVTAALGAGAAPASASPVCQPKPWAEPCCYQGTLPDQIWVQLTGQHLFDCPWIQP